MTLPLTTTPAQVVAPVGQTPPVQNVNQDNAATYNEGNGVTDTIVMTGPLSEIYTRALSVYFAKKPLDGPALAAESQALDNIRDTALSQSADIGLREIAGAVALQAPHEVVGNVDATVFAVDQTQIDRPEVIDALQRLRDRAEAGGTDYVLMAGVVQPLGESVPMFMGTNANYEITNLESNPPLGTDHGFARATESYCATLGHPLVLGLEGLAQWIIGRQAKKAPTLESLKPDQESKYAARLQALKVRRGDVGIAKEGIMDIFKKREKGPDRAKVLAEAKVHALASMTREGDGFGSERIEKALATLSGPGKAEIHTKPGIFGHTSNVYELLKFFKELKKYYDALPGHLDQHMALNAAHQKAVVEMMQELTSFDEGIKDWDDVIWSHANTYAVGLYPKFLKLANTNYFPHAYRSIPTTFITSLHGLQYQGIERVVVHENEFFNPPSMNGLEKDKKGEKSYQLEIEAADKKLIADFLKSASEDLKKAYLKSMGSDAVNADLKKMADKSDGDFYYTEAPYRDQYDKVYKMVEDIYQGNTYNYVNKALAILLEIADSVHTYEAG